MTTNKERNNNFTNKFEAVRFRHVVYKKGIACIDYCFAAEQSADWMPYLLRKLKYDRDIYLLRVSWMPKDTSSRVIRDINNSDDKAL